MTSDFDLDSLPEWLTSIPLEEVLQEDEGEMECPDFLR